MIEMLRLQWGFRSWRFGIFWHNRKHFNFNRWNDITCLTVSIFQIGKLTGRKCH